MPIFAGVIGALFGKLFDIFAAKLSFNVAFALAIASTSAIAVAALKTALSAIWAAFVLSVPTEVSTGLAMFFPSNLGTCISAIVLVDVIRTAFDYWRMTAGYVVGAMGK